MSAADQLIVALDQPTLREALACAQRLKGLVRWVKVGSILFTAAGPEAVTRMRGLGLRVMLDLKFFDIPSTVELSCRAAVRQRVALVTVHASGQREMLEAAMRGIRDEARKTRIKPPQVLAVTVLTSTGAGAARGTRRRVLDLARGAQHAGCDGVVASAREAPALRKAFGRTLRILCPGIRPRHAQMGDQERIATPAEAVARGADWLVVGRPITAAADPRRAAERILQEMEDGVRVPNNMPPRLRWA